MHPAQSPPGPRKLQLHPPRPPRTPRHPPRPPLGGLSHFRWRCGSSSSANPARISMKGISVKHGLCT